jgi:hypothetical protein
VVRLGDFVKDQVVKEKQSIGETQALAGGFRQFLPQKAVEWRARKI